MNAAKRRALATDALSKALKFRLKNGVSYTGPFPLYDVVEKMGIELRFIEVSSMEGMYCKDPGPLILVNSERPAGRKAFTCAHELGHHLYKHGIKIDHLAESYSANQEDEFIADCFAGFLLMPPTAVKNALFVRGWSFATLTADQSYLLSNVFGVGYVSFLTHICFSLRFVEQEQYELLIKAQPSEIKKSKLGYSFSKHLVVIDDAWPNTSVDLEVGDKVYLATDAKVEGQSLIKCESNPNRAILKAAVPGLSIVSIKKSSVNIGVRVSKQFFQGRSIYRHLGDPDYGVDTD